MEEEPGREDLFQKARGTRTETAAEHIQTCAKSRCRELPSRAWPLLAHLEKTIFSNPRGMKPAPDTARLEILACGRQIGEIETIGRRIKRLLIEGDVGQGSPESFQCSADWQSAFHVRPGQIAVVFRQPQPLADLVRRFFTRLQIPFYMENAESLARSSPVVMLVRLLELDAEDWPMHKLLGVLGNNYFWPAGLEWDGLAASRAEAANRGLRRPRGRERLLERLAVGWVKRSAAPALSEDGGSALRMTHPTNDETAHRVVRGLADALDKLPRLDTLAAYAGAWDAFADQTGVFRAMRGGDGAAWEQMLHAAEESQKLAEWLGQDAPLLDRTQARDALLDILRSQSIRGSNDEFGRVRVLSATSARHVKAPLPHSGGAEREVVSRGRERTRRLQPRRATAADRIGPSAAQPQRPADGRNAAVLRGDPRGHDAALAELSVGR